MTAPHAPGGEPFGEDLFRRITPPPGPPPRPSVFAVIARWRIELLVAALVAGLWHLAGGVVVGLVAVALALSAAAVPAVRRLVAAAIRVVVVPHRVRAGLVQAGVGDRSGRPPWLPWARPVGPNGVSVAVWLRAGTTQSDLRAATSVIAAACGATAVAIEQRGSRHDWAVVLVVRPRWGWPGR